MSNPRSLPDYTGSGSVIIYINTLMLNNQTIMKKSTYAIIALVAVYSVGLLVLYSLLLGAVATSSI